MSQPMRICRQLILCAYRGVLACIPESMGIDLNGGVRAETDEEEE
jgi:hypothetical protein